MLLILLRINCWNAEYMQVKLHNNIKLMSSLLESPCCLSLAVRTRSKSVPQYLKPFVISVQCFLIFSSAMSDYLQFVLPNFVLCFLCPKSSCPFFLCTSYVLSNSQVRQASGLLKVISSYPAQSFPIQLFYFCGSILSNKSVVTVYLSPCINTTSLNTSLRVKTILSYLILFSCYVAHK